mmetsp:Transcript_18325/g.57651  ORF Transcript_18325/g.57651 Transcript_18325/m.57651 type:complete len:97 (+) Transcript_18325:1036-1326(+)
MFPMMKPEVLTDLAGCPTCEVAIDRLWCARTANKLGVPPEETCAILDQATVVHTNGKTLRKWEGITIGHDNINDVRSAFPKEYVDGGDLADFRCVQ